MAVRTIGITGATGCLGSAWLQHLLARDESLQVIALARDPNEAATGLAPLLARDIQRITWRRADLADLRFSEDDLKAMARVDGGWWHFGAVTSLATDPATARRTHAVNVDGTRRLLEALRRIETESPFNHISTAYVAGKRTGLALEKPVEPGTCFRNPYEQTKAAAEHHVWHYFSEGRDGCIFRPSVVIGENNGSTRSHFAGLLLQGFDKCVEAGVRNLVLGIPADAGLNLVSLDWIVSALIRVAKANRAPSIYHLTAPRDTTLATLASAAAEFVPGLGIEFDPDVRTRDLPRACRQFNFMLNGIRDYLGSRLTFDRTNIRNALSSPLASDGAVDFIDHNFEHDGHDGSRFRPGAHLFRHLVGTVEHPREQDLRQRRLPAVEHETSKAFARRPR